MGSKHFDWVAIILSSVNENCAFQGQHFVFFWLFSAKKSFSLRVSIIWTAGPTYSGLICP